MQDPQITPDVIRSHGLTSDEYDRILQILGRAPNYTELGIFSVMWSEHCSYKSSRVHLRKFPTTGPRVVQGPGENAGVIDIDDGWVAAFKMESHNHPSFIEPYQGAATGVGGILRDIFTMGARPIASLDSLRFGELDAPRMKYLVDGVVRGISGYGNCIGIPTVGGETSFHPSYNGNILVNVFSLGVARAEKIFKGTAEGVGNPVIYVGSKTGRDGIHGATMASAEFDEASEEKRPTVQVGDPFTEKLLLEACLEIMDSDAIVGIQDMGAAGLTSSSFEMAGRAGTGIRMDLDRVPVRESGMTPYEIMLSESQERMLIVAKKGCESEVIRTFEKWDLNAAVVGEVTDDGFVRLYWHGAEAAAIPVEPISTEAPVYERPMARPEYLEAITPTLQRDRVGDNDLTDTLLHLVATANLSSKHWIFEQYDTTVRTNTIGGPEKRDAAVVRVKETGRGLAMTSDVNPVYCYLDPYEGGKQAVAEAARNIAASGARPVAITDCLNFGSPERAEIMWQFAEAIRGISDACRALETPVVSGNVSFYNETEGRAVYPTPTVGMVGLMASDRDGCGLAFPDRDLDVILLGDTRDELGGSEWQQAFAKNAMAAPPRVNLDREKALVELLLELHRTHTLRSAHDLANGGLAVALAEMAMDGIGCHVELGGHADDLDATGLLFSESQARAVVACRAEDRDRVLGAAKNAGVAAQRIGYTAYGTFLIERNGMPIVRTSAQELARVWRSAFALLLGGDTPEEVVRGVGEEAPEVFGVR
ncbi:MAG TPA: phosphoribosylformylglycinamidine synthase subunit PurL [Thermoanaerobaculia bacterium]|jgi:phosphoribosylformylglycinamidine synthase|nr:phosphoribosylformylglycinamidine synthase subunit PurL [Thermoanaerobaculia bacterium]